MAPVPSKPLPEDGEHRKYLLSSSGPNSFRILCHINGTPFNLFITSGCSSNLASESLVTNLGLTSIDHPSPYELHGLTGAQIWVSKQAQIAFSVRCCEGFYKEDILFDVVPMPEDCIILGRPWQFDRRAMYDGYLNQYMFELNDKSIVLRSDANLESET